MAGFIGAAPKNPKSQEPPLITSETNWAFGFIPKNSWVAHHYILTNPHRDTITITEIEPGCDCTHTPRPPIKIPPGETYQFKVEFDTRTYFGDTNRDIRLVTSFEPNPEMFLYFMSVASRDPHTITVTPQSTAFIPGKTEQEFVIKNFHENETKFKIFVDYDRTISVSETSFTLERDEEMKFQVKPLWDKIPKGSNYTCLVVEVTRKEENFRVSIPIKLNNF